MRLFFSLLLTLSLLACSSIPMSSLVKLASMDESDLVAVNPSEIKVRVSIAEPYGLVSDKIHLVLAFDYEHAESVQYDYALELVDKTHSKSVVSWFSNEPAKNIYTFRLTRLAQLEYEKLKKSQIISHPPKSYVWRVNYWLDPLPENGTAIGLDLELKLANEDDFFYLLKNAEMTVEVISQ